MPPLIPKSWTTDPEYIDLLNFLIERTEHVESPICIKLLTREFKERSGSALTVRCLQLRIERMRTHIHSFEHIDTNMKVKLMFALSAPVNADFLKQLNKSARVVVDEQNRITHYKANNGDLELSGDHRTRPAHLESKRNHCKLIRDYFKNKNNADAVPENEEKKGMWNFIEFITEKCENVKSPLIINQLTKEFNEHFSISVHTEAVRKRIKSYCREIQKSEFLDTQTSVKQLFCLSATADSDYLVKLRKDAHVDVDEENRISYYKAKNGSLELRRDHSQSAKVKTALLEAKRSHQKLIRDYFENKNDVGAVPENDEEKEMWNLIEFITEKCENVKSPLIINQLTKDFNMQFGLSRSLDFIYNRVRGYCRELQTLKFLDTHSKIKQLFGLSATLDSNSLTELRKDAEVEVDDLNRIKKYTANNGRLTLCGNHSSSAKKKLGWIEWKKKRNAAKNFCNSGGDYKDESEKEIDHSEKVSDKYYSEEVNSDDDNHRMDESEDLGKPLKTTYDSEKKNDDGGNRKNNKNPKRKNISPTAPPSEKKRNKSTSGCSGSKWTGPFSNNSMKPNKLDDYDTSYSIDDQVKLEPFRGLIQEDFKEFNGDEDIQQILKPPQALDEHNQIEEVPIKVEPEEPEIVENLTEDAKPEIAQAHVEHNEVIEISIKLEHEEPVDVKPETSHNPKIKFFEAIQSLIVCLDNPSLSEIQSEINRNIKELEKSDEVILNKKILLTIELLIYRMTNHSVVNLSNTVESVNLSSFLCYLKAAILNSKLSGMEDLVKNINKLIEESQNKRIPIEKVGNALRATLDIDCF